MPRQTGEIMLITETSPMSYITEAYRTLRTNTRFAAVDGPARIICVTSCRQEEGKTTTASNLAITYAQEGKRTLLIDADLRKPNLHRAFSISNRMGLTHYLAQQLTLDQVIVATHIDCLWLLPSGPIPPNPAELLASGTMDALLREIEPYDVIVIDSPPVLAVTDAQIIAAKSDGVLLVIHAGKIKRAAAIKAKTRLEHVKAKIMGVVLNGRKNSSGDLQYYGYVENN